MPKKKKRRKPRPAPRMHRSGASRPTRGEPDLVASIRATMVSSNPFELLHMVSSMLTLVDPRTRDPFAGDEEQMTLGPLLDSFLEVALPETTAVLAALGALVDDDVTRQRIRRELAVRDDPPLWLRDLEPLEVERVVEVSEVLGDGTNMLIGARTGAGQQFSVVLFIDHNLGGPAKDGFVIHEAIDQALATFRKASGDDPDLRFADFDRADAQARISESIESGARTYPPFETESWPNARPLIEWVVRHLPPGGQGDEWPEWSDEQREELAERFFSSEHGAGLDAEGRDLVDTLLWFGCDYSSGDPLRWSPARVELLLADWLPRKVVADVGYLARAPELLRRFIRFAHDERDIRAGLTAETLAAVDMWEPGYQAAIRAPRPQGPAAMLAAMGAISEEEAIASSFPGIPDFGPMILDGLVRDVGGDEALRSLATDPLPDEPLDLDGVPADITDKVREVAALTDACCNALLDVEHRTACRRLLRDVAVADPDIFRRRGRTETAAAALVWIVGKANDAFSQYAGGLHAKTVGEWLGVGSNPGQRASTLLKALGAESGRHDVSLGTPRYLVAARRRRIVELRDRYSR